jgi:hypothetical protein
VAVHSDDDVPIDPLTGAMTIEVVTAASRLSDPGSFIPGLMSPVLEMTSRSLARWHFPPSVVFVTFVSIRGLRGQERVSKSNSIPV